MARIGTNMKVEVESTLGAAITASAITAANPPVVTASAHGLTTGDVVVGFFTAGMVELNGQACRVIVNSSSEFQLEGVEGVGYSAFTAGTFKEVTAWHTISGAQSMTMPNPAPQKIDVTTLIDKAKQYAYALPDAPDGTISGLYDPTNGGVAEIKTATKANESRVFRVTWAGAQITIFNALVSGGSGFDLQQNQAAKADISFTPVKDVCDYAS